MPHVLVEYSANVEDAVDVRALVRALHGVVLDSGLAPRTGVRTRAARREVYEVADGAPQNMFVAVVARLAAGRSAEQRDRLLDALLAAVETTLGPVRRTTAISVEYQEIDPAMRRNRNGLGDSGDGTPGPRPEPPT